LWLLTIFIVRSFRDPPRQVPAQANAVLSPADGRIVKVRRCAIPTPDREALL